MAASRNTFGIFSSRICQFYRESHGLRVPVCNLSTSQVCHKKTPHTVGVPAWAKAGLRRKKVLLEMKKPKSEKQIQAEFNLENDPTELNLYTTTRKGPLPEYTADSESRIEKAKITMSADKTMFVCYHPAKPFPLQFSKDIGYHVWWHQDTDYTENYRDHLTKEEVVEVKKLRGEDPKVWTVIALSRMLEVKPLAILLAATLTDEQKFELEVERKLLNEWSVSKRKIYRANQELERLRYYQETRGNSPENEGKNVKSESDEVSSAKIAQSGT
ncbi:uncharacterized protein LOC111335782 [Stylophora pistillata]|uniref:Uncharacterized protein n=1 Tax=Stylophora pistillata TaxID=50429 RepID=A0A2B4RS70_STYPI|nr:uncharacterized protein LOC111335782 [Stylophora pistillata]PFX21284.1 hypothetical protein AWC38_SpisGene14209 [Stylophora pistillata]